MIAAALLAAAELASGNGSAQTVARRPVSFAIRSYAADIEVGLSSDSTVSVSAPGQRVRLLGGGGDRIEVDFGGKRQLHDGKVRVMLPRGSALDAGAVTGKVSLAGVGGPARVRGMSGEIHLSGASEVDVETVDGPVDVAEAAGAVRIHTVSGSAAVATAQPSVKLEIESASGAVTFRGPCGSGCHLDVDSVSGEVRFGIDPKSSLTARVVSTSGKVKDELGLALKKKPGGSEGDFSEGNLGSGDGLVECETFSGNVTFQGI